MFAIKILKKKAFILQYKAKIKNKSLIIKKVSNYLLFFILLILLLFAIKFIFKKKNNINFFEEEYKQETIDYKGEKVQKEKLIEDYLSRITENDNIKYRERYLLYKYLYLDEYIGNTKVKSRIKSKIISVMKSTKIDKIETFYIKKINNFGNNLISVKKCYFLLSNCKM